MSAYEDEIAALASSAGTTIHVAGDGAMATRLRGRFAGSTAPTGTEPDVVVLASSGEHGLEHALRQVATLGTVIVAGPPEPATVAVDLYVDLHARGITLIGMPGPPNAD